jgi:hypothetical protein
VIFGLPVTIIVLVVAAAITALARHETMTNRSVSGFIGCAGLGLLIASIALRNPWLFLAVAMMIVLGLSWAAVRPTGPATARQAGTRRSAHGRSRRVVMALLAAPRAAIWWSRT